MTYLSNLPGILASGSLKAKSLLDMEKANYQDPTTELIRDEHKKKYETGKIFKNLYVIEEEQLKSVECTNSKKSCNLEDYVRLYLFNDGSLGPNYLFRFAEYSWQKYGGFVLLVFKPIIDLLRSAVDYYFMLGSALSGYRKIYGDLSSFTQDLLESIHKHLQEYRLALEYKRVKNSLAEVLKWLLSSELGILYTIPLSQVKALFIFIDSKHEEYFKKMLETFEPTENEVPSRPSTKKLRVFIIEKTLQQILCSSDDNFDDFLMSLCTKKIHELFLRGVQVESWVMKSEYPLSPSNTVSVINAILAFFNEGWVCPLP